MDEQSVSEMSDNKPKGYYQLYKKKCAICKCRQTENVSMHRIPKNPIWRQVWCNAVKKEIASSARVCSNHFKPDDYRPGTRRMLKFDAVPSLNLERKTIKAETKLSPRYQIPMQRAQRSPGKRDMVSIKLENRFDIPRPTSSFKLENRFSSPSRPIASFKLENPFSSPRPIGSFKLQNRFSSPRPTASIKMENGFSNTRPTTSIKMENGFSNTRPTTSIKMENHLSDDNSESTDSEADLCYIYYLDEQQNVKFYKTYRP